MIERQLHEIGELQNAGAWIEAGKRLESLLARFPADPMVHRTIALQASGTGRMTLALDHMQIASRLAPGSVELMFQLGCLQAHDGRYPEAIEQFRRTTTRSPSHADGWYFLGITLLRLKKELEALPALRNAYRLDPRHLRALRALADLEFRIGFPADALPLWQELARRQPDDVDACLKAGESLSRLGFHDEALASYQAALQRMPDTADLWMALAQAHEDNDDKLAAEGAYNRALELKPDWAFPMSGLLGLQRGHASEAMIERAVKLQAEPQLPDADRALIGYELGKVYDGRGDHAAAMASWSTANESRKRMIGEPDVVRLHANVQRTIDVFQPGFPWDCVPARSHDQRMIFIVGMPRSGTTLTEQIIASHPMAHGCGELPDLALIIRNLPLLMEAGFDWPESAGSITRSAMQEAISRYTQAAVRHASPTALRLVDKAPLNFFHLGLVAMMFPQARVIWCRRDPRDIAVSIYAENFSLEEQMATSFSGIGHYINAQEKIMRHWQATLPLPILESHYESLVSSPETEARKIIDFVGLEWDPACLDFHMSARGVQTPSRWQVKQPMHTRSVGRWRNYESAIAPLMEVIAGPR